jgi:GNAT superfamily N-acetyltransferase
VSDLEIRPTRFGAPVAQRLVALALAELVSRYGGSGDGNPIDPLEFDPPEGGFLIAWRDGEPVACAGWRTLPPPDDETPADVAEIKRMYAVPEARGTGVATALLQALEASAREAGMRRMILETGLAQPEAIAFYRRNGYERIPDYGYYKGYPDVVSFGRDL